MTTASGDLAALLPRIVLPNGGALLEQAIALLSRAPDERLLFVLFDHGGRYICAFERKGTSSGIALNFRDLVERALSNQAGGALLIHNHPSGDPTPSRDDVAATHMVEALFRPLELTLHDHLIVGSRRLVSLRRSGHLRPLTEVRA